MARTPAESHGGKSDSLAALADGLHRAAIHLLRRLKKTDAVTGLTPPQASALSVLVFGGPRTLNALAAAEQVKPPTMSRLVATMEQAGLATKTTDGEDRRIVHVAPTARGRALLEAGRARRLDTLKAELADLGARDRAALSAAVAILGRLNHGPAAAPRKAASRARATPTRTEI